MATATRTIRSPRGTTLTCKGWPQEAALRMLMNNLDPDVAERPDDLVVYGGSGKAARNWRIVRRDRPIAAVARARRNAARPVRQAGRRVSNPSRRAARAHRQRAARAGVGDLGELPRPRASRPHDVRADDRRQLDLHRQPGHRAGHVRNAGGRRPAPFRRHAVRPARRHRRARRHGWRPAAGGGDERRRGAGRRSRSAAHRAPPGDALSRRDDRQPRRGAATRVARWTRDGVARSIAPARERGGRAAGAGRARRHARRR